MRPMTNPNGAWQPLFSSFIQAGFECSSHLRKDGKRLDLIASTQHDRFAREDYARMKLLGMRTAREGLRWHLIEPTPGKYDFSSVKPRIAAARDEGIQVIWDLVHFGWPDKLNVFDAAWVQSLGELAMRFARFWKSEMGDEPAFVAPVNEISFLAWAGGDQGFMNPFAQGRGGEMKTQLIWGSLHAVAALRSELRNVKIVSPEPVIHIVGDPKKPGDVDSAEAYRLSMFQAWDMLLGRLNPELGGWSGALDVIGVNYYERNQWWNYGATIWRGDPAYRPFHKILQEVWNRYRLPMFVAETGNENGRRAEWFAYIAAEVRTAIQLGVPVHGICLYPILNHPGWNDDRHCCNGLWDYAEPDGSRAVYEPLAQEILKQEEIRARSAQLLSGQGEH